MIIDLFLLYEFLKRLSTPFDRWKAYEAGIIDADGNILRKRETLRGEEKRYLGLFDLLVLNLKKLLAKIPGGASRIATFAAALFLLKEGENATEDNIEQLIASMESEHSALVEHILSGNSGLILTEEDGGTAAPVSSVPTNNTANIAGKEAPFDGKKFRQIKRRRS